MKNDTEKPIGYEFAKKYMPPDTSEETLLKAAENVENVIVVLYRICDRLVREKKEREMSGGAGAVGVLKGQ